MTQIPSGPMAGGRRLKIRSLLVASLIAGVGVAVAVTSNNGQPPFTADSNVAASGGLEITAKVFTAAGWVPPGGDFPLVLEYKAADSGSAAATLQVVVHDAAVYVDAIPSPDSGDGSAGAPLTWSLPALGAGAGGKIIATLQARTLEQDPEIIWKDISSTVTLTVGSDPQRLAHTHGPKVTTLESARYGDRPFPVVMVQYQDFKHCTGVDTPYPGCTGNHTAEALDEAVNSKTSNQSLWQLFQDLSFGQLYPIGTVSPPAGSGTVAFDPGYNHKFSTLEPNGTCSGTTLGAAHGTPAYGTRIENGWYLLPGNQGYYGSDSGGHAIGNPVSGIDDGCGPTAKIVYDAASLADPDIDYNEYDTDKDGVVDFFNLMFAGCGGHGCLDITGPNNIWPHKSDVRYYYTDENGVSGYVSNDQLKNHFDEPIFYTDATRKAFTTTDTGFPVYVVVGPYNVNPEDAVEKVSVVAHEYGHSLGLPDFYSNNFSAMGTWELMASDYFQYMTAYARSHLGWIVPKRLLTGEVTLRESKYDTGEITWYREDGTPYTLTGPGIHNADAYRIDLPTDLLIDAVPSGTHAWFSGAGNDFGCPPTEGHNLDVFLPDLQQHASAASVTLTFQSLYEIEWDWDYAFVMVSDDGGATWSTLASENGTTIENSYNPNDVGCFDFWNNGITGVYAGGGNALTNPNRAQNTYPDSGFIEDQFDLSAYAGKSILLRFSYFTDPAAVNRGWFIDDIKITADGTVVYESDFESGTEENRLFPDGWSWASTEQGLDVEHAYFIELRDRINNDYDGKNQSDRGVPGWQPGVALLYSDRQHSFGNTSAADHPGQTIVDAVPDPGNDSPNLNDAAFTLARPDFDGCTHIDNYPDPDGPGGLWKLPTQLKFTVTSITGLAADRTVIPAEPAVATVVAEVYPDCNLDLAAPVLEIAGGYEDPDTDGAFELAWVRSVDAIGPDTLQESSSCDPAFSDPASEPLVGGQNSLWSGSGQWNTQANPSDGSTAYYIANAAEQDESLTMVNALDIPAGYSSTLTFTTRQGTEAGYDFANVEVSSDDGPFETVASYSGPGGLTPDEVFVGTRSIDLSKFAGTAIKVRFRMTSDLFNIGQPAGWWVDNISIINSDWTEVLTDDVTEHKFVDHGDGDFCYRVKTKYPVGEQSLDSAYSNIVNLTVDLADLVPIADAGPDIDVTEGDPVALDGAASMDPEGQDLTFTWTQTAGPAVTLADDDTATPSFTAPDVDADTTLTFELEVADPGGLTATDTVDVTVLNLTLPPVADAGEDITVDEGASVFLDGSGSSDPEDQPLTYHWEQLSGPAVTLSASFATSPSFTAPEVDRTEALTFRLTVSDGTSESSDEVVVTVLDLSPPTTAGDTKILGGGLGTGLLLVFAATASIFRRRLVVRQAGAVPGQLGGWRGQE